MATFGLIPGAGGDAWYWHRVEPELREHGHDTVAVDLPAGDDTAGLAEYVGAVVHAVTGADGLVLVAQSMGGFTAPLVCDRVPVDLLVLVNAMIPLPGETGGAWWENTGQATAMRELAQREGRSPEFSVEEYFFHDVPADVTAEAFGRPFAQSDRPFADPWPRDSWPDVPIRFVIGRGDRFFPTAWMRAVVAERLAIEPDEVPGGHLVALSQPAELAAQLHRYVV